MSAHTAPQDALMQAAAEQAEIVKLGVGLDRLFRQTMERLGEVCEEDPGERLRVAVQQYAQLAGPEAALARMQAHGGWPPALGAEPNYGAVVCQ